MNKLEALLEKKKIIDSGHGGVNKKGEVVDCRIEPDAVPIPQHGHRPTQLHITIESGSDPRLFSATYATPIKIHVNAGVIYDSTKG